MTHLADLGGSAPADRALMGLLRATADAIVVGGGTVRSAPGHRWSPEAIFPPWADAYGELRRRLRLPPVPPTVVVSARGRLDLSRPFARAPGARVLVVTSRVGGRRLERLGLPGGTQLAVVGAGDRLSADSILRAVAGAGIRGRLLLEGGPHLLATFVAAGRLDELFLTVAPRIAGRDPSHPRLGLVEGQAFARGQLRGGRLLSVRTSDDLLFLRYGFRAGSF